MDEEYTISGTCRYCNRPAVIFSTTANGACFGLCDDHAAVYDAETDTVPAPVQQIEEVAE